MRVLLASWPTASHYFTMVSPAWALRSAGHDVRMAGPPGAEEAALRSGLTLSITGPQLDLASVWQGFTLVPPPGISAAEHERERARRALSMFTMGAEAMAEDMVALAREWRPDLVLYDPRMYAALKAARAVNAPAVRVIPGPDYTYARREAERADLEILWKRLGLGDTDPLGGLTLDGCPPDLQLPDALDRPNRQPVRHVPYNGSAVVPPWAAHRPDRPRVFVSLGTLVATVLGNMTFVQDVIRAIAALDVEVIAGVFTDQTGMLGGMPDNVRLVQDMPLHLLLPTCAAVVHHGGSGTLLTTAAHGVPQLVLSSVGDTVLNAERLAAAGAGTSIRAWEAAPDRIRTLVAELLEDPARRAGAGRLAAQNARQPAPAEVVGPLERLAATGRE